MSDDRRERPPRGRGGPPARGGGKPFKPRDRQDERPRGERSFRSRDGDGPKPGGFGSKRFGERPSGGKRFGDKPRFDKPRFDRPRPDGPRFDRARRDSDEAPPGERVDTPPGERAGAPPEGERIAKVMARAGLCSRRDAEEWIAEGRVSVNGAVIDSPALNVTEADRIAVDGEPLPERERTRLWLYHKPGGLVTTESDPEGRPTVFSRLPEDLPRVVSIGRLDINTEGLLLLTNDGGLARVLAHPDTAWLRRYRVRAHGETTQERLDALKEGIAIDGVDYDPIFATLDRTQGRNVWLTLDLREGKNREVKVVLEHLGLLVNRLIRVSFGPFQLGELREGEAEEVRTRMLKDQLGERLAAEAGTDFEGPRREPIHREPERPQRAARPGRDEERRPFREERPRRFVGERQERPHGERDERPRRSEDDRPRRSDDGERPRGRVLTSADDPYAPPAGWRSGKPSERNVYRDSEEPQKPRHKRLDKEGFQARRRTAAAGEDRSIRLTREETKDRAGRKVRVERIVEDAPREERPPRRDRDGDRGGFRAEQPFRPRRTEEERRPRRTDEERRPREERGERPPRRDDRPRSFGADRDGGRPFKPRGERGGFRSDEQRSERPRAGGFKAGGGKFAGKPGGRPSGKPGGGFGGRPGGFGGKPGGKPRGGPRRDR